jgi:hypothetical protein
VRKRRVGKKEGRLNEDFRTDRAGKKSTAKVSAFH